MEKKIDRRTAYTKQQLKDACYEALKKKPIEKITVTQLCKAADINRSTFYLHYPDVPAVYEEMLSEVLDAIEPQGKKVYGQPDTNWKLSSEIYNEIMHDERKAFLLKTGLNYEPFLGMYAERLAKWSLNSYKQRSSLSEDDLMLVLSSVFYSHLMCDRHYLQTHTVKELEHYNLMFNKYIFSPVHENLIST